MSDYSQGNLNIEKREKKQNKSVAIKRSKVNFPAINYFNDL